MSEFFNIDSKWINVDTKLLDPTGLEIRIELRMKSTHLTAGEKKIESQGGSVSGLTDYLSAQLFVELKESVLLPTIQTEYIDKQNPGLKIADVAHQVVYGDEAPPNFTTRPPV